MHRSGGAARLAGRGRRDASDHDEEKADPVESLPSRLEGFAVETFVGREHELTQLMEQWQQTRNGAVRLALASGEPGIGKTGLAAAFARRAALDGAQVAYGRCDDHLELPYEPWVNIAGCLSPTSSTDAFIRRVTTGGTSGDAAVSDPPGRTVPCPGGCRTADVGGVGTPAPRRDRRPALG